MFSKPASSTPPGGQPATPATPQSAAGPGSPTPSPETVVRPAAPRAPKGTSLISSDMTLEGNITGGGEIQIDGTVKGDVRAEHVTIGDGGQVEGGVYAEAVEIRGKVVGSVTAKQVRLYGACHVDGDITHEQLAMETGAFFQGRSLRLQRPAQPPAIPPRAEPAAPPRDNGAGAFSAKTAPTASA